MERRIKTLEKMVCILLAVVIALFIGLCSFASNMEEKTQEIINTVVAASQEQ